MDEIPPEILGKIVLFNQKSRHEVEERHIQGFVGET